MSVCLPTRKTEKPHGRTLPKFLLMSPGAVAGSSSGGTAICHVLLLLQSADDVMFSHNGPIKHHVYA